MSITAGSSQGLGRNRMHTMISPTSWPNAWLQEDVVLLQAAANPARIQKAPPVVGGP